MNEITEIRNNLYENIPSGQIDAFALVKIISDHLKELDKYIDSLPTKEVDAGQLEKINEVGLEMMAVLGKVVHAINHSNMKGTILHDELTNVLKKAMCTPFKVKHNG